MVWKNFIHYVINKYLKNYIERLDYEKLKLSLKTGHVNLDNLRLKPEALAYFNIPATVAVGYIERLQITIPWMHLNTKATEVHLSGLYLLIVPKSELSPDLNEHYSEKMARVQQKLENLRKSDPDNGKIYNREVPFVEKMRLQIMQNLVITVENVHISYEMKSSTKLGHPFSFGITMHYLELQTATNVLLSRRIEGNTLLVYKIKEMRSLSIYWNTKCQSRFDIPFNDVVNDLKSKVATDQNKLNNADMNYILRPMDIITECVVVLKPKESYYERTRMYCDIQVEKINIFVNSEQISDILAFIKVQNYTTFFDRCREYRQLLMQQSLGRQPITEEQKQRIYFLEMKLDVFNLAYIKHKVELEVNILHPQTKDQKFDQQGINSTRQSRWKSLSKVKHGFNHITKVIDQVKTTIATTTAAFAENEQEYYYEDSPKIDVELIVNKTDLNIMENNELIAYICVTDIWMNIKRMSVSRSIECMIDLQTAHIYGMQSNKEQRPILIMGTMSTFSPFVHVEFELFPADKKSDYRLHLVMQPLKVFYDEVIFNWLVDCFSSKDKLEWHPQTKAKQHTDLSPKKIFNIHMNLKKTALFLMQNNDTKQNFSTIRVQFNELTLKSSSDRKVIDNNLFQDNPEDRKFYAKYQFELSDLRIDYSDSNKNRLYILRRSPLIDICFYKCNYSHHPTLTKWRIGSKIALGDIQLSEVTVNKLIPHLESLSILRPKLLVILRRINRYFVIFSPQTSLISDVRIYNCSLRLLMYPPTLIRTDFQIYTSKAISESRRDRDAIITLNNPTMIRRSSSTIQQSSEISFGHDYIRLTYSTPSMELH
ncbi:unnamed protein product [Adineta ricciae]|uniref:Chorein N-terminal domain-containing protein n=1 Tax=Adineta ricciae TaxID=249248 RepID=A0A814PRM6_ADIRI|nr:unnamed protein product [Adineta ricciae]